MAAEPAPSRLPTAPLPEFAVEAVGLDKVYRGKDKAPGKHALQAVDLAIPRGALFGLLGPNGAGKSTFINILAGLVIKTGGTARVWGLDVSTEPRAARAAIGVVPQELNLDAFFTPRELLDLQAGLYGIPRAERRTEEILATVSLREQADSPARALSGGMRRRLMVAKAMVHSPPVLVLDEPTAGVDVELRRQLWSHIETLNRAGTTILLTTHYLEEAEMLCDRVAIIDHGRVIACDETAALVRRLDRKELAVTLAEDLAALPPALAAFDATLASPRRLLIRYRPSRTRAGEILDALRAAGLSIADLSTTEADLEDLFLEITGDGRAGAAAAAPERGR
ncbi:MAG TPA: ABC transporter ATP-binding protein [Alphaproteobacteria bacterium]|nr:ABC transporter ATP-binding protein [Alphaproteobacteria bacterium]